MKHFKSINHVRSVCICIDVQYLQTCSYTGNIPPNLWNSKQCVRKFNSRYYEPERQQNVRLHHMHPHQAKYSTGKSSNSLVSRMQSTSQVPIQQCVTETLVITYLQSHYLVYLQYYYRGDTVLHHTTAPNHTLTQIQLRSILPQFLLTFLTSPSIATKRLIPH
jgi:hypothetical protein